MKPASAGFSLIELLVVTAILSALAVGTSLAFLRPGGGESDAARLAAAVERSRDMALASGARHGLRLDDDGWQVLRFDAGTGAWQAAGGGRWSGRVRVPFPARDGAPQAEVLPDGEMSALRVEFYAGSGRTVCRAGGWDMLSCN